MASEQFHNAAQPTATLALAISPSATSIQLSSSANFPVLTAGQQCRIAVQDSASSNVELMLAIAPSSGTTYNVQRGIEGTTAISRVSGASVSAVGTSYHMQH